MIAEHDYKADRERLESALDERMKNAPHHTSGPWMITNAHIENGEWVIGIASEKQDGTLALIIGSKARDGYAQESIDATSNAMLIAAAPELLEALRRVVSYVSSPVPARASDGIMDAARAAIAKAKGGAA